MRESHLAKIDERLLRPYLLRRADYSTHVRDLNHDEPVDAATATTPGHAQPLSASLIMTDGNASSSLNLFGGGQGGGQGSANNMSELEKVKRLDQVMRDLDAWSKPVVGP